MKIQILSDLHIEFCALELPKTDADVVVLAGDIGVGTGGIYWAMSSKITEPIIYVAGNHEFYHNDINLIDEQLHDIADSVENLYILEDSELVIKDTRFLGCTLWTDFDLFKGTYDAAMLTAQHNMNDYRIIKNKGDTLNTMDTLFLHKNSVKFLKSKLEEPFDGKTVIITHHAPSIKSIDAKYLKDQLTPAYASDLEYMMGQKVSLWIHGHVHISNDYFINGTRIISNPRGYQREWENQPENRNFNPGFVVEI